MQKETINIVTSQYVKKRQVAADRQIVTGN